MSSDLEKIINLEQARYASSFLSLSNTISNFSIRSFIPFSLLMSVAVNSDTAFPALALTSSDSRSAMIACCSFYMAVTIFHSQIYSSMFCTTFPLRILAGF